MQTTLEMYLIMVTKVGHWNHVETLSPGTRLPTKEKTKKRNKKGEQKEATPLFQYTMTLIY